MWYSGLPWLLLAFSSAAIVYLLFTRPTGTERLRRRLPTHWPLHSQPVFSAEERRMYRRLREALPRHVLLTHVRLDRFCVPTEAGQRPHWLGVLGDSEVAFAVCSPRGRVLLALDFDGPDTSAALVAQQIKEAALSAAHVRYLRCSLHTLPLTSELRALAERAALTPPPVAAHPVTAPRSARHPVLGEDSALDSVLFNDSYFSLNDPRQPDSVSPFTTAMAELHHSSTGVDVPLSAASPESGAHVVRTHSPRYRRND